jgi:hypothetical protein
MDRVRERQGLAVIVLGPALGIIVQPDCAIAGLQKVDMVGQGKILEPQNSAHLAHDAAKFVAASHTFNKIE